MRLREIEASGSSGSGYYPGEEVYRELEGLRVKVAMIEEYLLERVFCVAYGYERGDEKALVAVLKELGVENPIEAMEAWRVGAGIRTDQEICDANNAEKGLL